MSSTNPHPRRYRIAEVCFCGGVTGYTALLPRRRTPLDLLRAYRRRGTHTDVEPLMTRAMLETFVSDNEADADLPMRWEGDTAVVTDMSDEEWIGNTLTPVERSDAERPSERLTPRRDGLYRVASFDSVGMYVWKWSEVTLPWPEGHVDARTIVRLLTTPTNDSGTTYNRVKQRADIHEIAGALELASTTSLQKHICYLLMQRGAGDRALALPALLPLLSDADSSLRVEAADAIARIASDEGHGACLAAAPRAGDIAFAALTVETHDYARAMLASAVGNLHHEPAVPVLIELLTHDDRHVRHAAAWSLGVMRVAAAEPALRRALDRESDKYAIERMHDALAAIAANG